MSKIIPSNNDKTNITYQPLLDTESSLMFFLSEPAISTISFFKGDVDLNESKRWLKDRLTTICKANPLLAGRLVRNKKIHKNVLLKIPQPLSEADVDALICVDTNNNLSSMSSQTPYETIVDTLHKSKLVVGPGYKLVNKGDLRVSKFTLSKVADGEVALVVSITHAVADGHTYYKIMSMFSTGDVEELSATRKHDFIPKSIEAIGKKEGSYLQSFSFMLCCIKSMLSGPKAILEARYIDQDKVKELKATYNNEEGFISTNDILTSSFCQATNADLTLMAINLRGRVEDTNDEDAGNYSLVVLHDKESTTTPSSVRQLLSNGPPFTRKSNSLPGFFKTITSTKVSMITSWAFPQWKADMTLPSTTSGESIPLELHLPIPYHPKEVAFPVAVIFRPSAGKLGILYGGKDTSLITRMLEAAPLGEKISSSMFPG